MATTPTGTGLTKGARITGADRQALGARLAERYQAGESIRSLAQDTGRSFGFVHGVIKESGVPLRGRGGATRRSTPAVAAATPAKPVTEASSTVADDTTAKPKGAKSKKGDAKKAVATKDDRKSGSKKDKAGKKKGRS